MNLHRLCYDCTVGIFWSLEYFQIKAHSIFQFVWGREITKFLNIKAEKCKTCTWNHILDIQNLFCPCMLHHFSSKTFRNYDGFIFQLSWIVEKFKNLLPLEIKDLRNNPKYKRTTTMSSIKCSITNSAWSYHDHTKLELTFRCSTRASENLRGFSSSTGTITVPPLLSGGCLLSKTSFLLRRNKCHSMYLQCSTS